MEAIRAQIGVLENALLLGTVPQENEEKVKKKIVALRVELAAFKPPDVHCETTRLITQLSKDNGDFIEDSVRAKAEDRFGTATLSPLLARSLYDVMLLASPHGTSQEQIHVGTNKLLEVVKGRFSAYVNALYELTKTKSLKDPNGLLDKNPWVVTNEIAFDNIGACFAIIKADGTIGELVRKVLFASPKKTHELHPLLRSDGPGLSVLMWSATNEQMFVDELECDCRGKVDLLQPTRRAVVMGAEVKRSSSAIPEAKKQLVVRFHVIKYALEHVYGIKPELIIFIGRVFYRRTPEGSKALESEDGSGNDLDVLSFYYHKM